MQKVIRIDGSTGKVINADREVHVSKTDWRSGSNPEPDEIKWIVVHKGGGSPGPPPTFKLRFSTPFGAVTFPTNQAQSISGPIGTYKYDVLDVNNIVTDDPNVIIES